MSISTLNNQLFLDVASGPAGSSPPYNIATATFQTRAINMEERRRISVTINFGGGHTGIFSVQGTDELGNAWGTAQGNFVGQQPGQNQQTGALYWNQIPSGSYNVTNSTQSVLLSFTDICPYWIRFVYNNTNPGSAVGSGTISLFVTAKNT